MMTRRISLFAAVLIGAILMPFSKTAQSADDKFAREFFSHAAEWSIAQVELSQLCTGVESTVGVRHYATAQIDGYKDLLAEVRNMARNKDYSIPKEMPDHQQKSFDNLKKMHGIERDRWYMKDQVDEQKALMDMFEKGAKDFGAAKDREWATKWHKNIRDRYNDSVDLYKKIKD